MSGPRQIIHVDMDAFFASVEQLDRPELRGKPVVVGGASKRGVVAAASYESRRFGVRSAMPMVEALRRCPDAVVVPPSRTRYSEVSKQVFSVFRRFTPLVEGLSVDEAFLDVTGSQALFGDGPTIAQRVRRAIREETGLTASAGVAPSKFVAKIASDLDKPDGLVVVTEEHVLRFLSDLPIRRMWGVGPTAGARLSAARFKTIGDLARARPERLEQLLGSWGRHVHALANGIDDREVVPGSLAKSVGAEVTFETDLTSREQIEERLLHQSDRVARRLIKSNLCGQVVAVKIKYGDFTLRSRQTRLTEPAADLDTIYGAAKELLTRFPNLGRGVRLAGVAVSDLTEGPPPPTLFPDEQQERRFELQRTVSSLTDRFGVAGITRASLLTKTSKGD